MTSKVIEFQGYDYEVTRINGCDVERFYLDSTRNDKIVSSTILYHGDSFADAHDNLMKYWQPPMKWYFCGNELRHT